LSRTGLEIKQERWGFQEIVILGADHEVFRMHIGHFGGNHQHRTTQFGATKRGVVHL
jgi:hypothetical protein